MAVDVDQLSMVTLASVHLDTLVLDAKSMWMNAPRSRARTEAHAGMGQILTHANALLDSLVGIARSTITIAMQSKS